MTTPEPRTGDDPASGPRTREHAAVGSRTLGEPAVARRLVATLGGRWSSEMGIDVDRDPDGPERWFLAATLFAHPISAEVVVRTYGALARAGVRTIADAGRATWDALVVLLDEGGYVRYDFRTATRLLALARAVDDRWRGRATDALRAVEDPEALAAALDALPGWGPTTVRIFLRELRGVWPGARPALDERAAWAADHLALWLAPDREPDGARLEALASTAALDPRDLESALIRLALAHGRRRAPCPGGERCTALADRRYDLATVSRHPTG